MYPTNIPSYPDTQGGEYLGAAGSGKGLSQILDDYGADITALATKVGIDASLAALNKVLVGTGDKTSEWSDTLAGLTLTTPKIDTISEETNAHGVDIDGLNIKDGKLNTNNSVVASNLTSGIINNTKLDTTAGDLGGAWVAFTPTFIFTGAASQNCDKVGHYTQIGKTIHFRAKMTVNVSSNFTGLTAISMNLPVTASSSISAFTVLGGVFFRDTPSGIWSLGRTVLLSTAAAAIWAEAAGGTYITASDITGAIPFGWGVGDYFIVSGTYEAA